MYNLINDYIISPSISCLNTYVFEPAKGWLVNTAKETATKLFASTVATTSLQSIIEGESETPQNEMGFTDRIGETIRELPEKASNFTKGKLYETGTSIVLSTINSGMPTATGKALTYLAPKATFLASTKRNSETIAKDIAIGSISHAVGTLAQEYTNNTLPTMSPYVGYVSYGISSAITTMSLNRLSKLS